MNSSVRRLPWSMGVGVLFLALTLSFAYMLAAARSRVSHPPLPVYSQVADFSLTNEIGARVSLADLQGRVWIGDIIFTRCPGPCLRMSRQMKELQQSLPASSRARLVSLTTDPDYDTPPVLTKYARQFDADTNRWMFLTGTKKGIGDLAVGSLKLSAVEKKPEERASDDDLFVHSTIFVVVDKHAQLRGVFQTGGEGVDWNVEKAKILATVQQLERQK